MAISDFAIELPDEELAYRITETVVVRGVVKFSTSSTLRLKSLTVRLDGVTTTSVRSADGKTHTLVSNFLSIPPVDAGIPAENKRKDGFQFPSGDCSIEFSIILPQDKCKTLPASHSSQYPDDAKASITYTLTAEMVTASKLFSFSKTKVATEELDFPRVNVPAMVRTETAGALASLEGQDGLVDYRIEVEPTVFGIGQPVAIRVHDIHSTRPDVKISSVHIYLVQHETIHVKNQQRTVSRTVAIPDPKIKLQQSKTDDNLERWHGNLTLLIPSTHIKDPPKELRANGHKVIDVYQSFDSQWVKVHHLFVVLIKFKAAGKHVSLPADVELEVPAVFIDADQEMREWVMRNYKSVDVQPASFKPDGPIIQSYEPIEE
ncbi:hypothetical protein HK104_004057 [Borealophlyctis nickersoniae]|nr:hypothetical protein HK104_004057 [Borealophlyctis nickersoniae]